MTPADTPWHFTTWLDLLDHWQTVIAGLVALIAAIITVLITLQVERRKADREVAALRKSLGAELRPQIVAARRVHASLQRLGSQPDETISLGMVERASRMPAPIIYSANAGKIGLLEGDAMEVVYLYTLLEGARDRVARLMTSEMPVGLDPAVVLSTAEAFLKACDYARGVLPKLQRLSTRT